MALAGVDTASLGAYSAENARDPALIGLRERIEIDFGRTAGHRPCAELEIELADGNRLTARHRCRHSRRRHRRSRPATRRKVRCARRAVARRPARRASCAKRSPGSTISPMSPDETCRRVTLTHQARWLAPLPRCGGASRCRTPLSSHRGRGGERARRVRACAGPSSTRSCRRRCRDGADRRRAKTFIADTLRRRNSRLADAVARRGSRHARRRRRRRRRRRCWAAAKGCRSCMRRCSTPIRSTPRNSIACTRRRLSHPMAASLPVLLGWAERDGGVSGARLIRAVVVAVDVAATLGLCSRAPMRFFRPANAGGFGATAGLAMLAGLDGDTATRRTRHLLRPVRRHDAGAQRRNAAIGDADGVCRAQRGDRGRTGAPRHAGASCADLRGFRLFCSVRWKGRSGAVRRARRALAHLRAQPQAVPQRAGDAWRHRRAAAPDESRRGDRRSGRRLPFSRAASDGAAGRPPGRRGHDPRLRPAVSAICRGRLPAPRRCRARRFHRGRRSPIRIR